MQPLKVTPAVLSLGKLCKDHGSSYEWVNGQEPRLTPNGEKYYLQDRQFRTFLSFQVYLSILEAVRLLQRYPQESLEPDARLFSGNRAASSSSPDSVLERSDEHAARKLGQKSKSDDKQDAKDPFADVSFWVEDSTGNLESARNACTSAQLILGTRRIRTFPTQVPIPISFPTTATSKPSHPELSAIKNLFQTPPTKRLRSSAPGMNMDRATQGLHANPAGVLQQATASR